MIRVVLADDHQLFLEALAARIDREPDFEVIGTATDTDAAFRLALDEEPDIVVLDVEMPGRGSFDVASQIISRRPATRVLFLSGYSSDVFLEQALRIRAAGYILKGESSDALLEHLRCVTMGDMRFSPVLQDRLHYDRRRDHYQTRTTRCLSALTNRQMEVLRHLVRGDSVKQVARTMVQSERAIESQKYRIMQQLGIHDRVELARFAIREGLAIP